LIVDVSAKQSEVVYLFFDKTVFCPILSKVSLASIC